MTTPTFRTVAQILKHLNLKPVATRIVLNVCWAAGWGCVQRRRALMWSEWYWYWYCRPLSTTGSGCGTLLSVPLAVVAVHSSQYHWQWLRYTSLNHLCMQLCPLCTSSLRMPVRLCDTFRTDAAVHDLMDGALCTHK
jgi:hypothetical protein